MGIKAVAGDRRDSHSLKHTFHVHVRLDDDGKSRRPCQHSGPGGFDVVHVISTQRCPPHGADELGGPSCVRSVACTFVLLDQLSHANLDRLLSHCHESEAVITARTLAWVAVTAWWLVVPSRTPHISRRARATRTTYYTHTHTHTPTPPPVASHYD